MMMKKTLKCGTTSTTISNGKAMLSISSPLNNNKMMMKMNNCCSRELSLLDSSLYNNTNNNNKRMMSTKTSSFSNTNADDNAQTMTLSSLNSENHQQQSSQVTLSELLSVKKQQVLMHHHQQSSSSSSHHNHLNKQNIEIHHSQKAGFHKKTIVNNNIAMLSNAGGLHQQHHHHHHENFYNIVAAATKQNVNNNNHHNTMMMTMDLNAQSILASASAAVLEIPGAGRIGSSTTSSIGMSEKKTSSNPVAAINNKMGFLPFETLGEFGALLKLKYFLQPAAISQNDESLKFCYDKLNQVSRSFALVIQELPEELKHPVAIFYLVLRGLDTVEDDVEYLKEDPAAKHDLLRTFYQKIRNPDFYLTDCGGSLSATAHYADLMLHFHHVCKIFLRLDEKYQRVIEDVTMKMGCGMVDYLGMTGVDTVKDYDEYCHYVAGLVGIGLSDMFIAFGEDKNALFKQGLSGSSDEPIKKSLSNLMGLFLQKVNIIRDYAEDIEEGRTFYPSAAFQQYGLTQVTDLKDPKNLPQALKTLNYLVTDALSHAPDCLEYMSNIKDPKVFGFCAIPQVMAIATLAEIYNNPKVFSGNVKIRKGLTARIFIETKTMEDVQKWFNKFSDDLKYKLAKNTQDPSAEQTKQALDNIQKKAGAKSMSNGLSLSKLFGILLTGWVYWALYGRSSNTVTTRASSSQGNTTLFGKMFGWTGWAAGA